MVDNEGNQLGVMTTGQALNLAHQRSLDLIEIAPNAQPPVCRIADFGKYKYDLEKKEKSSKQHQVHTKVKEIKFHPNVDTGDYATKLRHIRDFLTDGHRVKVTLAFRGRESAHQELGYQLMNRVLKDVNDLGASDRAPEHMGRNLIMMIQTRPGAKKVAPAQNAAP